MATGRLILDLRDCLARCLMKSLPALLLASQSPRRRELLACLGLPFEVAPAAVDEKVEPGELPQVYVARVAATKAQTIAPGVGPGWAVVGSDTAVVDRGEILGKPADEAEATRMLLRLRGREHQVYSAIAVVREGALWTDVCVTDVPMRAYTDEEIEAYVASGDPLDKAGAYAIQNPAFDPAPEVQGCFANVMGLPLCHLFRTLRKLDLLPPEDVPRRCQQMLGYDCPVYEGILQDLP